MKKLFLSLIFTFLLTFIGFSQNVRRITLNRIAAIDTLSDMKTKVVKDSVGSKGIYMKYTITFYYTSDVLHIKQLRKMVVLIDNQVDQIEETYYFSDYKLIYLFSKESEYNIQLSDFEFFMYQEKILVAMDGTSLMVNKEDKVRLYVQIKADLDIYEKLFY